MPETIEDRENPQETSRQTAEPAKSAKHWFEKSPSHSSHVNLAPHRGDAGLPGNMVVNARVYRIRRQLSAVHGRKSAFPNQIAAFKCIAKLREKDKRLWTWQSWKIHCDRHFRTR